jgi:hypothetical protein
VFEGVRMRGWVVFWEEEGFCSGFWAWEEGAAEEEATMLVEEEDDEGRGEGGLFNDESQ